MRRTSRSSNRGLGLVEGLVALAILALNVLGWSAALSLALALVRRIAELVAEMGTTSFDGAMCGLALLVPQFSARSRGDVCSVGAIASARRPRRSGLTLLEVLVALTVGVAVLSGIAAMLAGTSRAVRFASQSADAHIVRAAIPMLVSDVVAAAGRGFDDTCGLVASVGGARLVVRRALPDATVVEEEVFAGFDGAGRPALYLRRVPHARQPWVEDVTGFLVERIEFEPYTMAPARASSITLLVEHDALDGPLMFDVPLPHRPCVGAPP